MSLNNLHELEMVKAWRKSLKDFEAGVVEKGRRNQPQVAPSSGA
jgi:hypothetical protein